MAARLGAARPLRRTLLHSLAGPDLTPLIDVVLQMLIFFMLTSSFVFQPGVRIVLPKTVTSDVVAKENLQITVAQGDRLYLGERIVTLQELRSKLAAPSATGQPLLIRADRQASMGRVVEVWDMCRTLGISQVHIATDTLETDPAPGVSVPSP